MGGVNSTPAFNRVMNVDDMEGAWRALAAVDAGGHARVQFVGPNAHARTALAKCVCSVLGDRVVVLTRYHETLAIGLPRDTVVVIPDMTADFPSAKLVARLTHAVVAFGDVECPGLAGAKRFVQLPGADPTLLELALEEREAVLMRLAAIEGD